jgi:hypothetical protein
MRADTCAMDVARINYDFSAKMTTTVELITDDPPPGDGRPRGGPI